MKNIILAAAAAAIVVIPTTTHAQEAECYTGDYQGVPIEVCPQPEPDPTNCYWGEYQGAPIEVCMPTGWVPDPSWTYKGQPIVMHDSTAGVGVTDAGDTVAVAPPPAPPTEVFWLDELQSLLVEGGGW